MPIYAQPTTIDLPRMSGKLAVSECCPGPNRLGWGQPELTIAEQHTKLEKLLYPGSFLTHWHDGIIQSRS